MQPTKLAQRHFLMADQLWFAGLSGDFNPMHVDPVAARRTQAGVPAVHGIHLLMWSLEALAASEPGLPPLSRLRASFEKFVQLDETVEAWLIQRDASGFKIDIRTQGTMVARILGQFGSPGPHAAAPSGLRAQWPEAAEDVAFEQLPGRSGRVALAPIASGIGAAFPATVAAWGAARLASVIATTTVVGMLCPGLHSIYSGLVLTMTEPSSEDGLDYRVASTDERFRMVRMNLAGDGFTGTLSCFSRTPPMAQPKIAALAPLLERDAFTGSVALVVGGSRGLGELTAKLLAAGGAKVVITYARGRADADQVAAEIREWGGDCTTLAYDVLEAAAPQLDGLTLVPAHLYYFPTPSIFRLKTGLFDAQRLAEFTAFYVTGFFDLFQALQQRAENALSIFYPSSVAIDSRPKELTEYAMAKAAGELLCTDIAELVPGTQVVISRLPRLPTDLTASITPAEVADPIAVMLPLIRQVQQRRA